MYHACQVRHPSKGAMIYSPHVSSPLSYLASMREAAALGASLMVQARARGNSKSSLKADRSLVTEVDVAVEHAVSHFLRGAYPNSILISEEGVAATGRGAGETPALMFILDPIDGTNNFAHGLPETAVSLGCVVNGELVAGVVHAPFLQCIYTATKGGGAFRNDLRISATAATVLSEVLVSTGFPFLGDGEQWYDEQLARVHRVGKRARDIRRNGACSIDICRVADGTFGGFFETVQPWDVAAGRLIATEAGAVVSRYEPPQHTSYWTKRSDELGIDPHILCETVSGDAILVAAPGLHCELAELLTSA